jgi:hypothetical protein
VYCLATELNIGLTPVGHKKCHLSLKSLKKKKIITRLNSEQEFTPEVIPVLIVYSKAPVTSRAPGVYHISHVAPSGNKMGNGASSTNIVIDGEHVDESEKEKNNHTIKF